MRKQLSPGEWQILLALWRLDKRATVDEVVRELGEQPPPSKGKIRTLLARAIEKGYVRTALVKRSSGRSPTRGRPESRFFWPAVKRETATKDEIKRFVKVYLGDDPEAVALLKDIINQKRYQPKRKRSSGG